MPNTDQILRIAAEARGFLTGRWEALRAVHGWPRLPGQAPSDGMCLYSSCFLRWVLQAELPDAGWRVVGGSPEDPDRQGKPGGWRDGSGRWHGHHWVETETGALAVDVTLDQFGGPDVWLGDNRRNDGAAAGLRRNWMAGTVAEAVDCVAVEAWRWMDEWDFHHIPGWSASPTAAAPTGSPAVALSHLGGIGLDVRETQDGYAVIGRIGVPGFASPRFPSRGAALRWALDHPDAVAVLAEPGGAAPPPPGPDLRAAADGRADGDHHWVQGPDAGSPPTIAEWWSGGWAFAGENALCRDGRITVLSARLDPASLEPSQRTAELLGARPVPSAPPFR